MSDEEPTLEEVFRSEADTLDVYCQKLADAKLFLSADFNKMPENERFNRYKEYLSERASTQKQIDKQREIVIAAYNAMIAHNPQ